VKKLQAEKRLDLLVDAELKSEYNSLELEEMAPQ
jgi:somatic embryogenesis receptor kinase 1